MSDSDDFGGFVATPNPQRLSSGANGAIAGPSRTTTSNKRRVADSADSDNEPQEFRPKKRGASTAVKRMRQEKFQEADVEEVLPSDDGEAGSEEVQLVEQPKKTRGGPRKPTSRAAARTNGKLASSKGKGKVPVKPHSSAMASSRQPLQQTELMDVDPIEIGSDEAEGTPTGAINTASRPTKPGTSGGVNVTKSKHKAQSTQRGDGVVWLREQLQQKDEHIEDLKRQLGEMHQVRKTEPELLLERLEAQHQTERQAAESLIKDLTEQLQRKDPLLRNGKNTVFEILTREEANKENQMLLDQLKTYKDALKEREQALKKKDADITELETAKNDLRYELQMEIERGNKLALKASQKPATSVPRPRPGGVLPPTDDPKISTLVRFYEDLTNVLVTNLKPQPSRYLGLEDWTLQCIYSFRDVVDKTVPTKSLNFTVRLCHDKVVGLEGEPKNATDLIESAHYTPHDLEKESEEFVKALGFLDGDFTFERDQLALFMRTVHDSVSGEGKQDDDGSDNDIQVVG